MLRLLAWMKGEGGIDWLGELVLSKACHNLQSQELELVEGLRGDSKAGLTFLCTNQMMLQMSPLQQGSVWSGCCCEFGV